MNYKHLVDCRFLFKVEETNILRRKEKTGYWGKTLLTFFPPHKTENTLHRAELIQSQMHTLWL